MNKSEVLIYLQEKRKIIAPFEVAWRDKNLKQNQLKKAKKKWKISIIILWTLTLFCFTAIGQDQFVLFHTNSSGQFQIGAMGGAIILGSIAVVLMLRKNNYWVKPASQALQEAKQVFSQEANNPNYVNGSNSFPEEFYNYSDVYRLWRLINEGRAETLKEAYSLLEQQYFYEDQMSIQEEIKCLQQDIASAAKVSTVATTLTAVNTARIYSKMK